MKYCLLLLFLFATTAPLRAAALVEGRIYLKNGSVVECTGDDRLQLPQKSGKLKIFRDAFRKTKTKDVLPAGDIDSVICWHAKTPEHVRKLVWASDPGWMWVYVETPHIRACIYSKKGYCVDTNGGMLVRQRSGGSVARVWPISFRNMTKVNFKTLAVHTAVRKTFSANASPVI